MSQSIPVEFWNARYSEEGFAYGERASRLLLGWRDMLPAGGDALVPACGEGRDAVFLAQCGLNVTAVDISPAGLAKTTALAQSRGVSLTCVEADLAEWAWPRGTVDVLVANFLHVPGPARRPLHHRMLAALKPGGVLFLEGFTPEQIEFQQVYQSGGPPVADMLFDPEDILDDFAAVEALAFWTGTEHLTEGKYHRGPAALIRAVFRKT